MGVVKYSGPVASFHCPTNAEIRSLKVHFSPKQEGSGDPSPENVREISGWTGCNIVRTGKNIVDLGTQSFTRYKLIDLSYPIKAGTYKLSATITSTDTDASTTLIGFWDKAGGSQIASYTLSRNTRSTATITLSKDCKRIYLYASNGYVPSEGDTATWKDIQIELGSTATSYEPHNSSTIDYEFGILGKNKVPWVSPDGLTRNTAYNGTSDWSTIWTVPKNANGMEITYSADIDNTNGADSAYLHIWTKDENDNFVDTAICSTLLAVGSSGRLSKTITLDTNRYSYVMFGLTMNNATASHPMVELGSTATAYEPYDPNHTVYGGWVDLITGEVQEEWAYAECNDKTLWEEMTNDTCDFYYTHSFTGRKRFDTSYQGLVSSSFLIDNTKNAYMRWVGTGSDKVGIRNRTTSYTLTDIQQMAENGDISICYKLASPNTYYIATTQLQTFLGQNNVWSNADYVEVEYDLHETQDILNRKAFIIANQPHIETTSEDIVSFNTDISAPLKECKIHFSPVQVGSGDPSPSNVRTISGWTGCDVTRCGKNLFYTEWEQGTINGNTGELLYSDTRLRTKDFIKLKNGKRYVINVIGKQSTFKLRTYYMYTNNILTNYTMARDTFPSSTTPQSSENFVIIKIVINHNVDTTPITPADIAGTIIEEIPDDFPEYEPYTGITIPIDWTTEAGTIYGGYVDLITRNIYSNWIDLSFMFLHPPSAYRKVDDNLYFYTYNKHYTGLNAPPEVYMSNIFKNGSSTNPTAWSCGWSSIGWVRFYTDSTITNEEEFMNFVSSNSAMLLIKSSTPNIININNSYTLKSLRGVNNIFSNTNSDITVSYWKH